MLTYKEKESSSQILERLVALHPKLIDLSLNRMWRLLKKLGNPEARLPRVIHIAGTNGKGSTLAILEAIFKADGMRVDSYISPHLAKFNERIRLNGSVIGDNHLTDLLLRCEEVNDSKPITFFEITTAAAFLAFEQSNSDVLLLEVGLGGRLDATNVVSQPALSVITPISIDHTQYLGAQLEDIAKEKAGILKTGVNAVIGPQVEEVSQLIKSCAFRLNSPLVRYGYEWSVCKKQDKIYFRGNPGAHQFSLPKLAGAHQINNAGIAIACAETFWKSNISLSAIDEGLRKVEWPGRLQRVDLPLIPEDWEIWADGGHNVGAASALANARVWDDMPFHLVVGMINSKDPKNFLRPFMGIASSVTGVAIPNDPASLSSEEICRAAEFLNLEHFEAENINCAISNIVKRTNSASRILICGSLYLVGHLLSENNLI